MNDFETFMIECKKRGISVILDITFNHSSVYNEWFKASKNPESPYRSWYRWISDEDTDQPSLGYTGPYSLKQKALGGAVWNVDLRNRGLDYLGTLISQIINNQEENDRNNEPDNEDPSTYNGYARSLEGQYAMYAKNNPNYIDAPFLSNHDQVRSASALKNKPEKIKLAADMYILLEGVPFVYYGEEIAMKSGSDDPSKRTPLVWNKPGKDRFESSWNEGGPYRNSTVYNKKTVPISEQQSNPSSILNHYKRVIRIKTAHPALFKGRLRAEGVGSAVVESYFMDCDEETAFVLHNVSSIRTEVVLLPKDAVGMSLVYAGNSGVVLLGERLSIPPMTSVVLARNNIVQEKIIGQKEISDPAVKK